MPLFDYQCLQCAHIIEDILQKSDDDFDSWDDDETYHEEQDLIAMAGELTKTVNERIAITPKEKK